MVDYTVRTGNAGTLIIRDHGRAVEFLVVNGSSQTWINGATWGGHIGGSNVGGRFDIRGVATRSLGSWNVDSNMNVGFTLNATKTWGLGGPTSISVDITRKRAPGQASNLHASRIGHTDADFAFNRGDLNGGDYRFDQLQISSVPQTSMGDWSGSGVSTWEVGWGARVHRDNLALGTNYWVHARTINDVGWGAWSPILQFRTLAGARVKVNGSWQEAVPMVRVNGVWRQAIPFVRQSGSWRDGK